MQCITCNKDLLIPFARQQTYLRNILTTFKEIVDPLSDGIVDNLITNEVLGPGAIQEFTESACPVQHDRARRLWHRLLHVPPSMFFNKVVPLLEGIYPIFKTIGTSMSKIPVMCFRCVVIDVIPLPDIADEMCQNKVLKMSDHKYLHDNSVPLTTRWQAFFKMISTTEEIADMNSVLRSYLNKHKISAPEHLEQHLKERTPCGCARKKPQRSERSCSDCTEEPMEVIAAPGSVDEDMSDSVADCSPALRGVHGDRVTNMITEHTWVMDNIYEDSPSSPLQLNIEILSDSDDDFSAYLSLENDSDSSEDCDH